MAPMDLDPFVCHGFPSKENVVYLHAFAFHATTIGFNHHFYGQSNTLHAPQEGRR